MRKTVLSTVLASAIALVCPTAPVVADDRTDQWIAGAILLGLLGAVISDSEGRVELRLNDNRQVQPRHVTPLVPRHQYQEVRPRQTRALPAECLRRYNTRDGRIRLFDADCLETRFRGYRHLPLDCAVTIRSHGSFESGFRPRCLREAGYRLAGR